MAPRIAGVELVAASRGAMPTVHTALRDRREGGDEISAGQR
jgi:hypothetical protein